MKAIALFTICLFTLGMANSSFQCMANKDLSGVNLKQSELTKNGCMAECSNHSECKAITWVTTKRQMGRCSLKSLVDLNGTPIPKGNSFSVSCKKVASSTWVVMESMFIIGPLLQVIPDADIMDCMTYCDSNYYCNTINYSIPLRKCELLSRSTTVVPAGVGNNTAAIKQSYKYCSANFDPKGFGDVFNFDGSFQHCIQCMIPGVNAFTWVPSTMKPIGRCFCKKLDMYASDLLNNTFYMNNASVFCIN